MKVSVLGLRDFRSVSPCLIIGLAEAKVMLTATGWLAG